MSSSRRRILASNLGKYRFLPHYATCHPEPRSIVQVSYHVLSTRVGIQSLTLRQAQVGSAHKPKGSRCANHFRNASALVSLRTAPHSRAPAHVHHHPERGAGGRSRSVPRHKTLAGLNKMIAGLGQHRPVGTSRTAIPITWGCIEPRVFPERLLQQHINPRRTAAPRAFWVADTPAQRH